MHRDSWPMWAHCQDVLANAIHCPSPRAFVNELWKVYRFPANWFTRERRGAMCLWMRRCRGTARERLSVNSQVSKIPDLPRCGSQGFSGKAVNDQERFPARLHGNRVPASIANLQGCCGQVAEESLRYPRRGIHDGIHEKRAGRRDGCQEEGLSSWPRQSVSR